MEDFNQLLLEAGVTEDDIKELAMMLDEAMQELPKKLGKPDWTYKDLPRMTRPVLEDFIELVGKDNIEWITFADYDDDSVRGQVLLSPEAMAAIELVATKVSVN